MSRAVLYQGDARTVLAGLPAESVQTCVTSPPYWGLRDYGVKGQLGLEGSPGEYVASMVEVFAAVRRVLRDDGVCWLNLGDCYLNGDKGGYAKDRVKATDSMQRSNLGANFIGAPNRLWNGLPPKNLLGMPWLVAFALQTDGWWLRSDVIWSKPNPMPESVTDRPTRSHEYLFLLTKSERYYYDAQAIAERSVTLDPNHPSWRPSAEMIHQNGRKTFDAKRDGADGTNRAFRSLPRERNARSVWTIATCPYPGAHFATFPEELARRCILAGSSNRACEHCGAPWERVTETTEVPKDRMSGKGWLTAPSERPDGYKPTGLLKPTVGRQETIGWQPTCACENTGSGRCVVLDPFGGSGTVAQVATGNGRDSIYIDLNPKYLELAQQRIGPMLCEVA